MQSVPEISFIVPAYNMERYLDDAIQGILGQSGVDFEIIIVNDGSKDLTGDIADSYAAKDRRISVIHKKNGGISAARNDGIAAAKGEYICFLDSDDFYIEDFAREFYDICRRYDLDIIRGIYKIFDDETKDFRPHQKPNIDYYGKEMSGREFLIRSVKQQANEVVPWLGFFKRDYLIKHELVFPEGVAYEEDQLFFLKALLADKACRVMQTSSEFYAYRYRSDSVTKTPTIKQAQDVLLVTQREHELIKEKELTRRTRRAAYRYSCSSLYQLTSIYGRVKNEDKKKIRHIVPLQTSMKCLTHPYNSHQALKIFLFAFAPRLVDLVYWVKLGRKNG